MKQNNLYLRYSFSIQIISQEQLNVDIFSSHGQSSLGQEQPQEGEHLISVFVADIGICEQNVRPGNKPKPIIAHNIQVCSNILYSDVGSTTTANSLFQFCLRLNPRLGLQHLANV